MSYIKHIKFVTVVVVFNFLLAVLAAYLSHFFLNNVLSENAIAWDSLTEEFIVSIFAAPLLETALFQVIPYHFLLYVTKDTGVTGKVKNAIFIVGGSLLFASMHAYNWLYFVNALLGGFSLNYSYLYFRTQKFYPYLSVTITHLFYNLLVFLVKHFFG